MAVPKESAVLLLVSPSSSFILKFTFARVWPEEQGCQAWGKEGLGTSEGFPVCSGSSQGPAVHICVPEGCWMLQASGRCCPCTEGVSEKLGGAVRSHWQHAATAPGKNPTEMDF